MNISATELKQKTHLLNNIKNEDIVVTKRSKPFADIVDYEKYQELLQELNKKKIEKKLDALNSLKSFNLGGKDYAQIKREAKIWRYF